MRIRQSGIYIYVTRKGCLKNGALAGKPVNSKLLCPSAAFQDFPNHHMMKKINE